MESALSSTSKVLDIFALLLFSDVINPQRKTSATEGKQESRESFLN